MVIFPNCKINLGLNVLNKREDGYHNLQSIFLPVELYDALEIIESDTDKMFIYGKPIEGDQKLNSCFKALQILRKKKYFPCVQIHLLKKIPAGAGLGGGSSDGANTLVLLNEKFKLGFTKYELATMALQIGSDCPFFIHNKISFVEGRGEKFTEINFPFRNLLVAIALPDIHIDTSFAYSKLSASHTRHIKMEPDSFKKRIHNLSIQNWRHSINNDFESVIFPLYPEIENWKNKFYDLGAIYASMSGSGSTVYAIFNQSDMNDNLKSELDKNKKIILTKMLFEDERK